MTEMEKIIRILLKLKREKYSGNIVIVFNDGGIRSIKKMNHEPTKI